MVLRGQDLDSAVICTKNRTFDIKGAETSNSMLIIPDISVPSDIESERSDRRLTWRTVTGVSYKYLEIQQCRPKLRRLKELLTATPYTEMSRREGQRGLSRHDLLERVQASEEELERVQASEE